MNSLSVSNEEILDDIECSRYVVSIAKYDNVAAVRLNVTKQTVIVDGLDSVIPALGGFIKRNNVELATVLSSEYGASVIIREVQEE